MKAICTQENFKGAVINSERMVSRQGSLPILNNILFETEKGGLKLSATNLEMGVEVKIGAKIEKEGKITIPAKLISNFVNNLSATAEENSVFVETSENDMKIKTGPVKATIKGLPANEFPLIPKRKADFCLNLPAQKIRTAIFQVISCVSANETRQELSGVNVILGEDEIFFAATDSFRLAEIKIELKKDNKNSDIYSSLKERKPSLIIPANTLIELARIIGKEEEFLSIAIEDSQIFFETGGISLVSRLINGKYPEYKHIIPKEFKTRMVVEKEIMQNAIKMASPFSSGKSNEIVLKIDSEKEKASIGAKSAEVGENTVESKIEATGPSQEVIFNSRYVLDGINTAATSKIAILVNSASSPVAIKELDEKTGEVLGDYVYIVMPVKN